MLEKSSLESLKSSQNLLAFSAGVDSTALLFLLLENHIKFDIAIVDYNLRSQSKEEVAYAQRVAKEHNLKCHLYSADTIERNFEANARSIRYAFFEKIIEEYSYDTLLTAHHLGDRLEWMLMQFCKGAGCVELAGMRVEERRNGYRLFRPLLHRDKAELLEYLHAHDREYFIDASNSDMKYKRNEFRHNYAQPLLAKYREGVAQSFRYIDEDVALLVEEVKLKSLKELAYFKRAKTKRSNIYAIDRYLKSQGHLITANERALLKESSCLVLGRKYVVSQGEEYIIIAPYIKGSSMPKATKERMRLLGIEPKLRGYLAKESEVLRLLSLELE